MAELKVAGHDVVVVLSGLEALAACRREVRVPVRCLRMVQVEGTPLAGVSLLRLPGVSWPGAFVFGSRRQRGRKEFVAARAGLAAVVLEAEGAEWDRVVVSHPEAVQIAAELAALGALLSGAGAGTATGPRSPTGTGDGGALKTGRAASLTNGPASAPGTGGEVDVAFPSAPRPEDPRFPLSLPPKRAAERPGGSKNRFLGAPAAFGLDREQELRQTATKCG
jgi:hypothetical protein